MARRARRKRRAGLSRIMADVNDRALCGAPCAEQREAVGVDLLVPAARPGRRVEGLLHVDGEEDGAVEIDGHGRCLYKSAVPGAYKKGGGVDKRGACSRRSAAAKS